MSVPSFGAAATRLLLAVLVLGFLACNGDGTTEPASGDLQVAAATTGPDPDADGYTVTMDGTTSREIGANASISFADLEPGDYALELTGVAANCAVGGQNPRTVTVSSNQTASTSFSVTCVANVGDLEVATATTGTDPDPDGYTVSVDGGSAQAIGVNADVTISDLDAGNHSVQLSGVAANCTVSGNNPRTVSVPFNAMAQTAFQVACSANVGDLEVTTSTSGTNQDADGYTVTLDGAQSQNIGVNGSVTFDALAAGDHSVQLSGIAANCTLSGSNPRTVSVPFNGTAQASLVIVCGANVGNLEVTTSTGGTDLDGDGYSVRIDGTLTQNIGVNGTVTFTNLAATDHTVELTGLAANCSADGNPRTVSVPFNETAQTAFNVACVANVGSIQVTTETTGTDPDPDGYTVSVDGGTPQAVDANGSVTFSGLPVGSHSLQLSGAAANCTVGGSNPRAVSVSFNATTPTTFSITCVANVGSIQVTTETAGTDPDPDGYTVSVDGGAPQAVASNGNVTFSGLPVGDHSVAISGAAVNCTVGGSNPRTVSVSFNTTTPTTFSINCVANVGSLQVTTQTTGAGPQDPNGYTVLVDAVDQGAIAVSQTRTFSNLATADHTVALSGLAANCYVNGQNPRTVTVSFNTTTQTTFQVTCFAPLQNKIVFDTRRDGNYEIYVMDTDGTNQINLSNSPSSQDRQPTVSPDGLRIAFWRANETAVYVMNADGSNPVELVGSGSNNFTPAWSPNGTRIALSRQVSGNTDIWVINADGTGLSRITSHTALDRNPTWSPDGTKIAFETDRDGNLEVYVVSASGTEVDPVNLTNDPGLDFAPTWSPDSAKIAFSTDRNAQAGEIFVMDANGLNPVNLTNNVASDFEQDWSPDASKIVFTSLRHGNPEIYIMNADGSDVVRLTVHAAEDGQATFSP